MLFYPCGEGPIFSHGFIVAGSPCALYHFTGSTIMTVIYVHYMSSFMPAELSKTMLLTEFGNNRPDDILKTKLEVMHSLAVEPGQVVG